MQTRVERGVGLWPPLHPRIARVAGFARARRPTEVGQEAYSTKASSTERGRREIHQHPSLRAAALPDVESHSLLHRANRVIGYRRDTLGTLPQHAGKISRFPRDLAISLLKRLQLGDRHI